MRRIPTMMASAGAAALTALAVTVAAPAIGDDGGAGAGGQRGGTAEALGACLSAHGVTGVPAGDGLKQWLGQRLDTGDATVRAALEACAPKSAGPGDRTGDERQLRSCLADHGAAVPAVEGGDLKRWIVEHQGDPATAAALKACDLVIDDHPKPGGCEKDDPEGTSAAKPGDKPGVEAEAAKRAKAARHAQAARS